MLNKPRTNSGPHSQHVALKLSWEQGVFYQLIISNKKITTKNKMCNIYLALILHV